MIKNCEIMPYIFLFIIVTLWQIGYTEVPGDVIKMCSASDSNPRWGCLILTLC